MLTILIMYSCFRLNKFKRVTYCRPWLLIQKNHYSDKVNLRKVLVANRGNILFYFLFLFNSFFFLSDFVFVYLFVSSLILIYLIDVIIFLSSSRLIISIGLLIIRLFFLFPYLLFYFVILLSQSWFFF